MREFLALWGRVLLLSPLLLSPARAQGEWSGYVAGEARVFTHDAAFAGQEGSALSVAAQPEYYREWDDGRQSFLFVPFLRLDNRDPERSHADIRELTWLRAGEEWELRAGVRKVYWGVSESQHLVDIINQTDLVENPDGEDKLGQPMINLAWIQDWGTVDLFLLPGFRERTFPGSAGRLRSAAVVDTDRPSYESAAEDRHVDAALRWAHSIGDWDVGLSHFYGTSRDPRLLPVVSAPGQVRLRPHYDIIHQTGLDLQATKGDWLWKWEMIRREGQGDTFTASTAGFEYTLVGIRDSVTDLGLLMEYSFDDRGDAATAPFEDDLFLATRWAFNDVQSTEILAGIFMDLEHDGRLYNVEASRRLGNRWKLTAEIRVWGDFPPEDSLSAFREDDHLLVELARYF